VLASVTSEIAESLRLFGELAHRTGLSAAGVRRWLGIMRDEGLIEPTEEAVRSPGVRYRRVREPGTVRSSDTPGR
jgi:DNA-binding IclR family transcriptional regulator